MENKKKFEVNDEALDQVAGGLFDDSWANGRYEIGDILDISQMLPNGCKFCGAREVKTTITGISGINIDNVYSLRVESLCCGKNYYLNVNTGGFL